MNNIIAINSVRFLVVILVQIFIFNNINFLGYINPYIYIIFILIYPIKNNRMVFITLSFLLGLFIDMVMDSGGVHAAASVFLAYSRPLLLKSFFGTTYEYQSMKFSAVDFGNLLGYVSLATVCHHLVLFSLEIFNIYQILLVLKKTLFASIFTLIISVIFILLFGSRK